jgi:hypothetical protein
VRYRFEWSDRTDFGPGPRTTGVDDVRERDGPDTAYVIPEDLESDTWYYWRARVTITPPDGKRIVSGYSAVRSFRTPSRSSAELERSLTQLASRQRAIASDRDRAASAGEYDFVPSPSGLVATASGSGVVLTWMAPTDKLPQRYAISGGNASHVWNLPVVITPDASTHYVIPALPPGTYHFAVWAIFDDALSSPSNDAAVVIGGAASGRVLRGGARAHLTGRFATATWRSTTTIRRSGSQAHRRIGDVPSYGIQQLVSAGSISSASRCRTCVTCSFLCALLAS